MSGNPTDERPSHSFTPKELALYIGVPVATLCVAGGVYYYYTKKSQSKENIPISSITDAESSVPEIVKEADDNKLTPAEIAMSAKSKGNKYFSARRYEEAIKCYTQAIECCPSDCFNDISTFYQNRSAAFEKLKQWRRVVDDCNEAIKLNSKYTKAIGRRARAYEELNEKRNCLEDVTAVCLLEGFQNQSCMQLADRILKSIGKELAEKYFKERPKVLPSPVFVKSYLDSFNRDIFYVEIPDDEKTDCNYQKILNRMERREYNKVEDLCTKEILDDGLYRKYAHLLRGTLYTLMCNIEKAIADFNVVLHLEDSDVNNQLKIDALIKRGSLRMQEALDKECYEDFDLAMAIDSKNPNIHHHRGQLYFLTERLEEGRKDFKEAIALDPKFVAPRLQLGYCLSKIALQTMSHSLVNDANNILEETTRLFPECPEAWSLHGQLLQDQQKLDDALEKLDKAISLAPSNPTTYVYKALLMLQWRQDIDAAKSLIQKAIDMDDKCDFAYETLATLEVQKGNNEEAIRLFERAIDLVRTESEMANTFSLLEAAKAQAKITKLYGVSLPSMM